MSGGVTTETAHQQVRRLILAAGGSGEQIAAAAAEIGAARTVEMLVDEMVARADLDVAGTQTTPIVVRFEVGSAGGTVRHTVHAGKVVEHRPGAAEEPHATVATSLEWLAQAVYGPHAMKDGQGFAIRWHDLETPERLGTTMHVFPVVRRLVRAATHHPVDLGELSLRQGSDKWGLHYYTPHYERHFGPLRHRPLVVLELGIGGFGNPASGGGSLRMWKRFFPRAVFYGVDIFDKAPLREQRIHTVAGDLSNPDFLASLGADLGPFDVVIDDASHRSADVIGAFQTLFPYVRSGGLYVVEDLQTSYWPGYGGGTGLDDPATSMGFLKTLVDDLAHEERSGAGAAGRFAESISGIHFHRSLAFIEKGVNREGPSPSWIPRQLMTYEEMAAVDWGEGLSGE